ncbi:MAG TPA: hypothetical protein PLX15_01010 [Candidatus Woesearchaeota archaeon]|nr:hypothetical protein [Candidatus Woesearchaeota archaeon]
MKKSDLKNLDKEQLINLIIDLSKLSKENNAFLQTKLNKDYNKLFELSCNKISKALSCYELMSLRDARNTITDFKKSNPENNLLIELCLHYIKEAYDLEKTDWRFQENFYSAIEKVYNSIFETIKKDISLKERYLPEIKKLIQNSNEGWGHRDYLEDKMDELK